VQEKSPLNRHTSAALSAAALAAAAASSLLLAGCGGQDTFAKVNGQVVTKDEYISMLERQNVAIPGGAPTNAERFVLDQLIGNKVTLAEASKANVLPTDDQVNSLYKVQKNLFEQSVPGKEYEKFLSEQGTTPEQIKNDLRVQLAETGLFAKKLKLDENEVRQAYDRLRGSTGLPARAQLRVIVVGNGTPQFAEAQKLLAAKTKFADVAKKVNPPQMRNSGGLIQQAQAVAGMPPQWQAEYQKTAEGSYFGPVDFPNQPGAKAWVMVEKKLAAYNIPLEDAAPVIRRQLVQQKMLQPENASVRNEIMQLKMKADFQPTQKQYGDVWSAVKEQAQLAGIGETPAAPAAGAAPAPMAAAGGAAPGGAPAAAPK
jgi:hypothetical protein